MTRFPARKVLFDLDGTLVDTAADLHAATNHTLTTIGREIVSLNQVRHMTGYGALKLIEKGLEATGGTDTIEMDELRQTFLEYYGKNICVHSQPFPHAQKALEVLKAQGFAMAVCTNKPIEMAVPLIEKVGLAPYFDAITGGNSFEFKKPDPRHLIETWKLLAGSGPVVMVGDSTPDIKGAQAAQIPVIAVDFGYPDTPIVDQNPDVIISSFEELPALLSYQGP